MKVKLILFVIGFFMIALSAGFFEQPVSPPSKNYDLTIMKMGNVWKVVQSDNHKNTEVKVKRNETITWTVEGSNAYLQFPQELFNPVGKEDSLSNGYTKFLKNGKKLKLKVKDSAVPGTYEYAVFVTADGVFARGDSPPKIIIR
ncbi:MAG: hypothetical protein WCE54_18385 [Ignavibacteriaceae bacterium]